MPLTETEQKKINVNEPDDRIFLHQLAEFLFEMTGDAILKIRLDNIVEKL